MSLESSIWKVADRPEQRPGLPQYLSAIMAGWPSPAEDYVEGEIDFHKLLVRNPESTFVLMVAGDSMIGAGIFPGTRLVVDRSVTPVSGSIVIAALEGELTVKRLLHERGRTYLKPENAAYAPIDITEHEDVHVWGVVVHAVLTF